MIWLTAALGAFLIQSTYWVLLRRGFRNAESVGASSNSTAPVSIIVAARNEEGNISSVLQALVDQAGVEREIILVDDASTDRTAEITATLASTVFLRQPIRLFRLEEPKPPRKKTALAHGIAESKYAIVALTDADCTPGPGWIRAMTGMLDPYEDKVVVGYSPFREGAGWMNTMARYETFVVGFLTAATIGLNRPYMAVGRNLVYPKRVFDAIGGFEHSLHSMSGDDDLLIQEVARQGSAQIVHAFDPDSFVTTEAPKSWGEWIRQKLRHTSAGRYYNPSIKRHLLAFHGSNTLLWLAPLFAGWGGTALLVAKLALQWTVLKSAARTLREEDLMPWQPLLDLAYTFYNLTLAPLGVIREPTEW